jgi:hypothetical protein
MLLRRFFETNRLRNGSFRDSELPDFRASSSLDLDVNCSVGHRSKMDKTEMDRPPAVTNTESVGSRPGMHRQHRWPALLHAPFSLINSANEFAFSIAFLY